MDWDRDFRPQFPQIYKATSIKIGISAAQSARVVLGNCLSLTHLMQFFVSRFQTWVKFVNLEQFESVKFCSERVRQRPENLSHNCQDPPNPGNPRNFYFCISHRQRCSLSLLHRTDATPWAPRNSNRLASRRTPSSHLGCIYFHSSDSTLCNPTWNCCTP
jgi:hypothetical protein